MTLTELRKKDVIQVQTGVNLGRADDLRLNEQTAQVEGIILFGRARLFGLLGRQPDLFIPWQEITQMGQDVVLVRTEIPAGYTGRPPFVQKWFDK
ncbi:MAG: YlmC/YmxH family sporulation protein [Bacteroidales bacterium]|nr:YlmC/YmxH family sporulation protein [Fournierella massiliensis]MCF2558064.1 YlmC/YmxH family sporulation protein [Fournierella massiliensis]MCI6740835.1 YlmC/YmxH family sporulation protein [Bacteroidales bacterium]